MNSINLRSYLKLYRGFFNIRTQDAMKKPTDERSVATGARLKCNIPENEI